MEILFLNATIRNENISRTSKIAKAYINEFLGESDVNINTLNLISENLRPFNEEMLEKRSDLVSKKQYNDEIFKYANQFKNADLIVIAAPFWDFSFPSILKIYVEHIMVEGLVFSYNTCETLLKARKFVYITTSGGEFLPNDCGYTYFEKIFKEFFKISKNECIYAEMLDVFCEKTEEILQKACENAKIIAKQDILELRR